MTTPHLASGNQTGYLILLNKLTYMSCQLVQDLLMPNSPVFFIVPSPVPPTLDPITEKGQASPVNQGLPIHSEACMRNAVDSFSPKLDLPGQDLEAVRSLIALVSYFRP